MTTSPSPTSTLDPAQTPVTCKSCGRLIGPYEHCPYYDAASAGRPSLHAIKIAAVVLATVGLAALWWLARHTEIPQLAVGDATGMMNLAYVRLEGRITRNLSYDPETGHLGFWVTNDSDEIHVAAYRDVTAELLSEGTIPATGDDITVAGTLRVREDYVAPTVNVPEHLELHRAAPTRLHADDVTILDEGRRVHLQGEVARTYVPYEGLTLITLSDESGEIVIAVDEVVTALTGPLPEIREGEGIEVTGAVTLYKATPQIAPAAVTDIVLGAPPPNPPHPRHPHPPPHQHLLRPRQHFSCSAASPPKTKEAPSTPVGTS